MIKILWIIPLLLLGTINISASDTLKISAPPSIWIQKQGESLTGPVIELLEVIFSELHLKISPVALPWARAITQLKSGELDMIPVIFYTDDRARFMEFTIPYTMVPTAVFVPLGRTFTFDSLEDLIGRKGLMMREDSISPEFEIFQSKLNLTKIAAYDQMLKMLSNDRADYAVAAKFGFLVKAGKLGYIKNIEVLPRPVASRNLHFAFSKKSPFLKYLPAVNQKLKQLQADGTIENMVNETIRMAAGQ